MAVGDLEASREVRSAETAKEVVTRSGSRRRMCIPCQRMRRGR